MKRKLLRYAALLTAFLLLFGGGSCMKKDDTPVTSITDALKIKAYVYDESGETWNLEQLRLNEPKQLVRIAELQQKGLDMQNFNLHFEYEDGICIVTPPNRDIQVSVGAQGDYWKRGEDYTTRFYDFENDYEIILSRPGYMAVTPFGLVSGRNLVLTDRDVATFHDNYEPSIGHEYWLTVTACDFEKIPVITAQVKLTALENDIYDDGTSPDFSIEMVSYEYSDIYKLMEGAG